jgi:Na+/H+-dicarboxylate symporter
MLTMLLIPTAFFNMLVGIYFVQQEKKFGVIGIIVSLSSLILDSASMKYSH